MSKAPRPGIEPGRWMRRPSATGRSGDSRWDGHRIICLLSLFLRWNEQFAGVYYLLFSLDSDTTRGSFASGFDADLCWFRQLNLFITQKGSK